MCACVWVRVFVCVKLTLAITNGDGTGWHNRHTYVYNQGTGAYINTRAHILARTYVITCVHTY